jgi:hypothetical protein
MISLKLAPIIQISQMDMKPLWLNLNLEYLLVVHGLGQEGLAGDSFMIQNK